MYLGAVHELSCQAYVLHSAGAQQGLDKNLQRSGRRRDIMQGEAAFNRTKVVTLQHSSILSELSLRAVTCSLMCELQTTVSPKAQNENAGTLTHLITRLMLVQVLTIYG